MIVSFHVQRISNACQLAKDPANQHKWLDMSLVGSTDGKGAIQTLITLLLSSTCSVYFFPVLSMCGTLRAVKA